MNEMCDDSHLFLPHLIDLFFGIKCVIGKLNIEIKRMSQTQIYI